jgi:uncharacterized membrane protein YphA (DoxX/SURF4 family)
MVWKQIPVLSGISRRFAAVMMMMMMKVIIIIIIIINEKI